MYVLRHRMGVLPDPVKRFDGREQSVTLVEERHALYRSLVLDAAEQEFSRYGYADAKVTAIARAAGVSLATFYKAFPGKEEVWNELHRRRNAELLARVDEHIAAAATPLDRLLAGIGGAVDHLTEHTTYLELNLRTASGWLFGTGTTADQATVWAAGLRTIDAGLRAVGAAGQLGGLRPTIARGMVISALQVWLADWVDSGYDRDPDELRADLLAHLRTFLTATTDGSTS